MNRKELKADAKAAVAASDAPLKRITLVFLLCALGLLGLNLGMEALVSRMDGHTTYLSQAMSAQVRSYIVLVVFSLVCQLTLVLLWVGYHAVGLDLGRREQVSLDTLWDGFRLWSKTLLLYVYISLMVGLWGTVLTLPLSYILTAAYMTEALTMDQMMAATMILAALATFIVSYRYRLAWFILLDDPDKPVRQIVAEVKLLNRGHWFHLFLLDMSFVPWLLLGVLTCGVLLLWKLPYIMATYAGAYQFLIKDAERYRQRLEELLEQRRSGMGTRF